MRRSTRLVVVSSPLLAVLLAMGGMVIAQDAQPASVASPPAAVQKDAPAIATVSARYTVTISLDERVRLPELTNFILSQRSTKDSARVCLNLEKPPLFSAQADKEGEGMYRVTLSVALDPAVKDVRLGASEFLDAVVEALPNQLSGYGKNFIAAGTGRMRDRMQQMEAQAQFTRAEVSKLRSELRKQTGRADAIDNWAEAIASLEQERQKLALDAAGQQARRRAIEETIAKITNRAEQRAKNDDIAQELAKIVALREEELRRARQLLEVGRINEAEIANVGAMVAEARAKLLERREESARAAGGDLLGEFNRELLMLSINTAENEARLKLIQETLERFHGAAADVDALRLAEKNLTRVEAMLEAAYERQATMEDQQGELAVPSVSIVDRDHVTLQAWQKEKENENENDGENEN